jgi:CheY-like chemotaxis protein
MEYATPLVLVVEDDPVDAMLLRRTLKKIRSTIVVQIATDGEKAIEYLAGEGSFADRQRFPFPNFIITDLKMPGVDGFDVLEWLQRHADCFVIPTIVWSSSAQRSEVAKAYKLGANCYMQKPVDLKDWEEKLKLLVDFWCACEKPDLDLVKCAQPPVELSSAA